MIDAHILSLMIFFPVLGSIVILFIPSSRLGAIKGVATFFSAIPLLLAIRLFIIFDRAEAGLQFVERAPWIELFNIFYFVGTDGLSVSMILLTALLSHLAVVASFGIDKGQKGYFALILLLETAMLGVFAALDLFLFFIFWEVVLLPMYFLIGIWGGPKREYAAIKFFLYTLLGSILLLINILAFYFLSEPHTFDMIELANNSRFSLSFQLIAFVALYINFAIKVPVFPFHTWLPDAHVEAPTAVSVLLAGVLLKMGTYGLLRISFPILPEATRYFAFPMAILGAVNIIYGALCCMAQSDFKKLVAYSSISHMGFVLLGMSVFTDAAINGAVLQMFNHGIISAMLFLLVGVVYDRAHHRDINGFGGLGNKVPVYTGITSLAFFAGLGLPGLNGFISEVLVLIGSYQVYPVVTIVSTLGIILTAGYFLWALQRIFLGPLNPKYEGLAEINGREIYTLAPLGGLVVLLGVYPNPALDLLNATLAALIRSI